MNNEELKKRMKQIEYELHKAQSPKPVLNVATSGKIVKTRKLPLKYKFLIGFCGGICLFIALGLVLGGYNTYLIFTSLMLFISTMSIAFYLFISSIFTLAILYVAWKIYKSLV